MNGGSAFAKMKASLVAALLMLGFLQGGCSDASDGTIREAVLALDYRDQRSVDHARDVLFAESPGRVLDVLASLYESAPREEDRRSTMRALTYLTYEWSRRRPSERPGAVLRARDLARRAVTSRDPILARMGLSVLSHVGQSEDVALVGRLVGKQRSFPVVVDMFQFLVSRGAWDTVLVHLAMPCPDEHNSSALKEWREQMNAILVGVRVHVKGGRSVPHPVGERLLELIQSDAVVAYQAALCLVEMQASAAQRSALREAYEQQEHFRARVPLGAVVAVLEPENAEVERWLLGQFREAVASYANTGADYVRLAALNSWLAFVAAQKEDERLLERVWQACEPLGPRDRTALLHDMTTQCLNAPNVMLHFLNYSVSEDELRGMAQRSGSLVLAMDHLLWHFRNSGTLPRAIAGDVQDAVHRVERVVTEIQRGSANNNSPSVNMPDPRP